MLPAGATDRHRELGLSLALVQGQEEAQQIGEARDQLPRRRGVQHEARDLERLALGLFLGDQAFASDGDACPLRGGEHRPCD